jgi:hypothetical protein
MVIKILSIKKIKKIYLILIFIKNIFKNLIKNAKRLTELQNINTSIKDHKLNNFYQLNNKNIHVFLINSLIIFFNNLSILNQLT